MQLTLPILFEKRTLENNGLPRRNTNKVEIIKKRFKLHVEQSQLKEDKLKEAG